MSKQSNQRYRKEKEKDHLKKAGLEPAAAELSGSSRTKENHKHKS